VTEEKGTPGFGGLIRSHIGGGFFAIGPPVIKDKGSLKKYGEKYFPRLLITFAKTSLLFKKDFLYCICK